MYLFFWQRKHQAETCETRKEAHEKMVKSYEEYYPEDQNMTRADMSYLGEESAVVLKRRAEPVAGASMLFKHNNLAAWKQPGT